MLPPPTGINIWTRSRVLVLYFLTSQKPLILFPTRASYRLYLELVLLDLCMLGLPITYLVALSVLSSTVILHRSAKYSLASHKDPSWVYYYSPSTLISCVLSLCPLRPNSNSTQMIFYYTNLPILDYCSSLWDPNYAIHVSKLESVQKFAARFVTGRWSGSYDSLLSHLKWPKLSTRRKKQKFLLCNRILNNCSILPPSLFTPHPSLHLRHNHPFALYYPTCNSTAHLSSFAISVVPLWNCLPVDVVCAPSLYSFKKRLKFVDLL